MSETAEAAPSTSSTATNSSATITAAAQPLTEEQARAYMTKLLTAMTKLGASDLFISKDFPPSMKANGRMQPLASQKLSGERTRQLAEARGPIAQQRVHLRRGAAA